MCKLEWIIINIQGCLSFVSIYYDRDEGIIIAISYWQCILEVFFNLFIIIFTFVLHGEHLIVDRLIFIIVLGFVYLISPSFYLLADRRFRDILSQHGVVKALWSSLKQKYDWEENQKINIPSFMCLITHKFKIYVPTF